MHAVHQHRCLSRRWLRCFVTLLVGPISVQIINGNLPYDEVCRLLNILPLADRRLKLCRTLFQQMMRDDNVLHYHPNVTLSVS